MSEKYKRYKKPSELTVIAKDIFSAGKFILGALRPSFTRSADSELKAGVIYHVVNGKALLLARQAIVGDETITTFTAQLIGRTNDGFPLLKVQNEDGSGSFVMQTNWRGKKQSPIDIGLSSSANRDLKNGQEFKVVDINKFIRKVEQVVDNTSNEQNSSTDVKYIEVDNLDLRNGDVLVCNGFDQDSNLSFSLKDGTSFENIKIVMSDGKRLIPENMGLEHQKTKPLSRYEAVTVALSQTHRQI